MAIGSPKTAKAFIGTCEVRVGTLAQAGLLTSDHSVGYVDNVKLDIQSDTADLKAGFAPVLFDSAVTSTVTGFTGTLQESSRRNLNLLMSNGVADYDALSTDVGGTVANTSLTIGDNTGLHLVGPSGFTLAAGDMIVMYQVDDPSRMCICSVDTFTAPVSPAVYAVIDVSADTPFVGPASGSVAFAAGSTVKWYKAKVTSGGHDVYVPSYYSMQLIQLNRPTGRPVVFNFWKNFIVPSLSLTLGASDWSKFDMQVKSLRPYDLDYTDAASALYHVRDRIASRPIFEVLDIPDAVSV
ncbi:hypothetical protein [Methylovulum miyakonense]|uniref:hypothetical protein n=1 Tax=Methylovulum miyakonense TaxID=645578 RepID=UPI000366F4D3|nr:hypothetical protein [Methylovulum miyakonense]